MRIPMLFSVSFLLISCSGSLSLSSTSDLFSHNYEEVAAFSIEWKGLFFVAEPDYYVYVYSPGCSHCQALKDEVIDYALNQPRIPFYFVLADATIPKGTSPEETVGATAIDDAFIAGWPSLIEIKTAILIKYLLGTGAIRSELF